MRFLFSALLVSLLLFTGGSVVVGQSPATVTGAVTYRQRIALPPDAAIEVKLLDVSRQDAPAITLGQQVITAGGNQVPFPFAIQYDPGAIDARFTYAVQARITVDGKLMFITTRAYHVITRGSPTSDIEVVVDMVGGDCSFVFGFRTLHDLIPDIVGDCRGNERFVIDRGESVQETTGVDGKGGLLVWRKAGNFTGYTDGYRTWALGPNGLEQRLNTERFPWEVMQQLSNTEYRLPAGDAKAREIRVRMVNGRYELRQEYIAAGLWANYVAIGDLDSDGVPDAIAPVDIITGASGMFNYLVPFLDRDGLLVQADPEFIGDRVKINSVTISDGGAVTLSMITQGPNEPMCCPTMQATKTFKLLRNRLEPLPTTDPTILQNRTWEWQRRVYRGQETIMPQPGGYTVAFNPNGTLSAKLDCNRGVGGYAADTNSSIRMELRAVTLAACPPGSRDRDMVNMFAAVRDYRFEDNGNTLVMLWPADGPIDYFRAAATTSEPPKPAVDALNATYTIDGKPVTLVDGKAEQEIVPGAASKTITMAFGPPATGDLNGDGTADAALMLTQTSGGSGTFFYVVAALYEPASGTTAVTNAVLLGDRIAPQNIRIENGVVLANYAVRQPGEPMSAQPSVGVTKRLVVEGATLAEAKN